MTKYFSQDTPLAGLERMMMSVPGFQKRGGGMMVLCRFHYKKEDVDCTYCRSYMRHTCQESVCPYIPERLEAGTIGYQELAERCLRMAGHQKLWKRASSLSKGNTLPLALEPAHRHRLSEWPEAGTASICPQKLAAVYLLSSRIGLWRRVLPHISHGRIDFSSVSLRGIDPRDYPVYRAAKGLYCGKLLITSAELADEEQVSSEAFGDILNAMLIARYGKTIILTFMMSQAQAESESLSGNVRWGHRKNFKDGKVYYHCKTFLGYRWGADGQPEIDPEQAAIVRRIFSRFLLGHSVRQITTDLMADGIKTATGKTVWHDSVVQKMLCNEKYIGDAILQKTYIADLFTREKRVNNGELPKYYVHDCHPAIIDRETFQKVQEELARRSSLKKTSSKAKTQLGKYCGKYVLSELLVCGECGSPYRRVIWTQKGVKRVVWRCQNRLEHGRKICKQSPTLDEGDIHDAVISAMNELFRMQAAKDAVKAGIAAVLAGEEQTMSLPAVELQIRNLQERQLELFQLIVSAGADCTDYDEELQQVNIAKTRLMAQKAELEKEQRGAAAFESRLAELDMALEQASGTLTDFDELTVRQLVSNIKVLDKDSLLICFKDGTEITQAMQRRQAA